MKYVYLLQSINYPNETYVGLAERLVPSRIELLDIVCC